MIKLKKILQDIPGCKVHGSQEIPISGICANSKLAVAGNLFIAKKGKIDEGTAYLFEAIQAGAAAVVIDLFDPSLKTVVQVIHPFPSAIESALAGNFYHNPSQELFMVGITGTNGKTTTSFMIKELLQAFMGPCGLIGTIEYILGSHSYPATLTTPGAIANQKMLREMIAHGCRAAVMEVSSHGLDQGRVAKIDFDVAIFTNLTRDHLDYHGTMQNYGQSKKILFDQLGKGESKKNGLKWAIINQDSAWTPHITQGCSANLFSYGIENPADLRASNISFESQGTRATLSYQGQDFACYWPFVGRFNVYNVLAATAVAISQNIHLENVVDVLARLSPVRGRLQRVNNCLGIEIYVDFAHSDDSLKSVLATLRELKKPGARLIVVAGCGGDRDRAKRPKMAEACEGYADLSIATTDNPRSEDPQKICEEMVAGFSKREAYRIEPDRKMAIRMAIVLAQPEDIILIAGKGHETTQTFAHQTIVFDDFKVAEDLCRERAFELKINSLIA